MAQRSVATVTIAFGMLNVPVKLYAATESKDAVSFNMIHKNCGSRLKQAPMICVKEECPVDKAEIVKGYEFAKDQYVTFAPEELKALGEAGSHAIEIAEFVPADTVDPVFYSDKTYYVAPDKMGVRAYSLLAEAMRQTNQTAIGRYAVRGKQYIVQLRAVAAGIVMQTLLYAPEVRAIEALEIEQAPIKDAELALAKQLIASIATERFDPALYEDAVAKRVQAAIEAKIGGQEIVIPADAPAPAQVIDLMSALQASIAAPRKAPATPAAPAPTEAPAEATAPAKKAGRKAA